MAKFCGKCGSKLDETTGICPKCDATKIQDSSVQEKVIKIPKQKQEVPQVSEKLTSKNSTKKKRKTILFLCIVLFAIFACGVAGTLEYFNIIDVPYIFALSERVGGKEDVSKDALTYIDDSSEVSGIKNDNEEFEEYKNEESEEYKTDNILSNSYYKFEQKDERVSAHDSNKMSSEVVLNSKYALLNVPYGAVEFKDHYYYIYGFNDLERSNYHSNDNEESITDWNSAKAFCEAKGGYLATITSAEEDKFLYSYITDSGYSSVMFGLTQDASNVWTWISGEDFFYENWSWGEPNNQGGYEHYGMYYEKNTDGSWNDGSGVGGAFICEWDKDEIASKIDAPVRTMSDERDIVLVLDVSGSMSGTPMDETKKASVNFVNTILNEDASIGVVTYDNSSYMLSDFSVDKNILTNTITNIYDGGGTNIEAGLVEAHTMLNKSGAKKKIIVLMSDGEPNEGKDGDDLINYADEIKNDDIIIYTVGFFEGLGDYKSYAQLLMEGIASDGCHYEVAGADDLVFFFEDMADQINGQKYIYIRIACPVDVTVTHNGETLCSSEDDLNLRTGFGTLTFEENENVTDADEDDRIKVLRLKEGTDYDVQIVGTGHGIMDYTIGFMDENGDYSDFRRFEDIKITRRTTIDTVVAASKESILKIDEDGDGRYDLELRAEENGYGEEVEKSVLFYVAVSGCILLILLILILIIRKNLKNKKAKEKN